MKATEIRNLLTSYRLPTSTEDELQLAIAKLLTDARVPFHREHRLDEKSRLDFFLPAAGLAIEVKTKGGWADVIRQMMRYAEHDCVTEILLVSTRAVHRNMPKTLNEKPILVASLLEGAF